MRRIVSIFLCSSLLLPAALAEGRAAEVRTTAFRELGQGVSAYKQGDYARAAELLESAASAALNNFRAHFYWGLALIGDRRYREAIDALEIALDLDPTHLQSHVAMGDAQLKLGDVDEATASYYRALKLRPEYPAALDGVARGYRAKADEVEAIAQFRRAIAANKGYAPSYTHLGDLYLEQRRYEEAVELLEEAVSIRADYAPGLNRLALAYGKLGLDTEAIASIQRAIELQPNNADHRATLGQLQLAQDFVTAAESSFVAALELDDGQPDAHLGLAEISRRYGDYEDAIAQVDLALEDERLTASGRLRLTEFQQTVRDEQARFESLEAAVAAGEAESDQLAALAEIYAGRLMWERAAELTALEQESPDRQERLAYLYFRLGRYREAHRLYRELREVAPSATLALNDGVTLVRLGDERAAAESFRASLALDPSDAQARLYLANSLLRQGLRAEAVDAYAGYLEANPLGKSAERVRRILRRLAPERLKREEPAATETATLPAPPEVES